MDSLLTTSYNSYIRFLSRLNKGRVDQDYSLTYDAILCLRNNIIDEIYVQFFINNLIY